MSRVTREQLEAIRAAVDGYGREELVEILTWVLRTYVVEGAVLPVGAGAVLEARSELEGLGFAQLVTWLQQHLELPELGAFEVQGERVIVRSGAQSLELGRVAPPPSPPPAPVAAPPAPVAAPPAPVAAPPAPVAAPPALTQAASSAPAPSPSAPAPEKPEPSPSGPDSRFKRLEVD